MKYNYVKKLTSDRDREFDIEVSNKLNIIKKRHKSKKQIKNIRNKKFQDVIINNWKLYGYYIEPTEKEIENEIITDELKESDEIEYISLEELKNDYEI